VNAGELAEGIPTLLDMSYPGQAQRVGDMPGWSDTPDDVRRTAELIWLLPLDEVLCVVQVHPTSNPFVSFRSGLATEIPSVPELAMFVAVVNKEFAVGRMYYEPANSIVVVEETIFAAPLSFQFMPSMQDLVGRMNESINQARRIGPQIRERFGGRPLKPSEWMLVAFSS
jgi:hypothetical protein